MEETKKCPYCAEDIKKEAIYCRYCKSKLDEELKKKSLEINTNNINKTKEQKSPSPFKKVKGTHEELSDVMFYIKEEKVIISKKLKNHNEVLSKFIKLEKDSLLDISKSYNLNFNDFDGFIENGYEWGMNIVHNKIKESIVSKLIKDFEVYDIDEKMIMQEYNELFDFWTNTYRDIKQIWLEIEGDIDAAEAYRNERKATRSKWEGYGYGVKGALKAGAKAGALNIASGLAHSFVNSIGNNIDKEKARKQKEEIFQDISFKKNIITSLGNTIRFLYQAYKVIIKKYKSLEFYNYSEENNKKIEPLFNNLSSGRIPDSEIIKVSIKIIALNPYFNEIYEFLLKKYKNDKKIVKEVILISDYFQLDSSAEYLYKNLNNKNLIIDVFDNKIIEMFKFFSLWLSFKNDENVKNDLEYMLSLFHEKFKNYNLIIDSLYENKLNVKYLLMNISDSLTMEVFFFDIEYFYKNKYIVDGINYNTIEDVNIRRNELLVIKNKQKKKREKKREKEKEKRRRNARASKYFAYFWNSLFFLSFILIFILKYCSKGN